MGETFILQPVCDGCGACKNFCRKNAIYFNSKDKFSIDLAKCDDCGLCVEECPLNAISKPNKIVVTNPDLVLSAAAAVFPGVKAIFLEEANHRISFIMDCTSENGYITASPVVYDYSAYGYIEVTSNGLGVTDVPDRLMLTNQVTLDQAHQIKALLDEYDLAWDKNIKKLVFRVSKRVPIGSKYFYFDSDFAIKEATDTGASVGMDANRFKVQNYFRKRERAEKMVHKMMVYLTNMYPIDNYWE